MNHAKKLSFELVNLSNSQARCMLSIMEIIELEISKRKSEKKLYIPLSHFPSDISKFDIRKSLEILESDFKLLNFLGFANGEKEEFVDITFQNNNKLFELKKLIEDRIKSKPHVFILKSSKIVFDDTKGTLTVNGTRCQFPFHKNEHELLRALYKKDLGKPVSWDVLYDEIQGEEPKDKDSDMRSIRDAMYAVNNRIMSCFGTQEKFLTWKNKSIIRNF